jgi:hypothetical protein
MDTIMDYTDVYFSISNPVISISEESSFRQFHISMTALNIYLERLDFFIVSHLRENLMPDSQVASTQNVDLTLICSITCPKVHIRLKLYSVLEENILASLSFLDFSAKAEFSQKFKFVMYYFKFVILIFF